MSDGAMTPLAWLALAGALAAVGATTDVWVMGDPKDRDHAQYAGDVFIPDPSPTDVVRNHTRVTSDVGSSSNGVTSDVGSSSNGVTSDVGSSSNGVTVTDDVDLFYEFDGFQLPELNSSEVKEGGSGPPAEPPGCVLVLDDLPSHACAGMQRKYKADDAGYIEYDCQGKTLECSVWPPLPARRPGPFQRVELTSCVLPPAQSLACLTGGERVHDLMIKSSFSSVTAENVAALDLEDLFIETRRGLGGVGSVPAAAIAASPRLRSARFFVQGSGTELHADMFSHAASLATLEVSDAGVTRLGNYTFRGLDRLETLSLWGNQIDEVEEEAFYGLSSLSKLVLEDNPLSVLSGGALCRARRLRTLLLSRVGLRALHEHTFCSLRHLETIVVSSSSRAPLAVRARALADLPSLRSLTLTWSRVAALPPDLFRHSTALVNLTLSNNRLESLPRDVFSGLAALRRLQLDGNLLRALPHDLFLPLAALQDLSLQHNKIQELPQYVFSGMSSLTSVDLSHNELHRISSLSFSNAASLQRLSLSHNRLSWTNNVYEDSSPFYMLTNLQILDLSHNNISVVYYDWRYILRALTSLDLSYNTVTELQASDMDFVENVSVDLSHNNISVVRARSLRARLALDNNPFRCDCQLYYFLTQLTDNDGRYGVEDAECAAPAALAGRRLATVAPREVTCDVPAPPGCACAVRLATPRIECRCNTTAVESVSDPRVKEMSLQVSRAPSRAALRRLSPLVRELNLTALNLTEFPPLPPTVLYADLSHNNITSLPPTFWRQNLSVSLAHNPISCECSTTGDILLIKQHRHKIVDFDEVSCSDGTNIRDKDANVLCDVFKSTLAASLVTAALIVVAACTLLLYRYRVDIQVFLYSKRWCMFLLPKENADLDKKYDVFVSFSIKDEMFVREQLLPKLEGRYSLHVQDRDWEVGSTIPGEIHRSVAESRRTLILLSAHFYRSLWAREEFRAVHAQATSDKRPRAVVVLTDIRTRDIDKETKLMLSLSTIIRYDEAMFWDKLRWALPRKDMYDYTGVQGAPGSVRDVQGAPGSLRDATELKLWKNQKGLNVIINNEGKLVNQGYVKDVV